MPEIFRQVPLEDDDVGIDGGIEQAKQRGAVAETRLFQILFLWWQRRASLENTLIGRHAANTAAD